MKFGYPVLGEEVKEVEADEFVHVGRGGETVAVPPPNRNPQTQSGRCRSWRVCVCARVCVCVSGCKRAHAHTPVVKVIHLELGDVTFKGFQLLHLDAPEGAQLQDFTWGPAARSEFFGHCC